jgi:hypothetical protein
MVWPRSEKPTPFVVLVVVLMLRSQGSNERREHDGSCGRLVRVPTAPALRVDVLRGTSPLLLLHDAALHRGPVPVRHHPGLLRRRGRRRAVRRGRGRRVHCPAQLVLRRRPHLDIAMPRLNVAAGNGSNSVNCFYLYISSLAGPDSLVTTNCALGLALSAPSPPSSSQASTNIAVATVLLGSFGGKNRVQ